jgi:hypothetical protein
MNVWELKEILADVPDHTPVVIEGVNDSYVRAWGVSHEQARCINGTFCLQTDGPVTVLIVA